jgi:hypothetical protein
MKENYPFVTSSIELKMHHQWDNVIAEIGIQLHAILPIDVEISTLSLYVRNLGRWYFYESFPTGI